MTRVREWGVDLDKLVLVDRIFNDVADDKTSIAEGRAMLAGLQRRAPLYSRASMILATAILSGAAAVFFRGGAIEMAMSAFIGGVVGLLGARASRDASGRFLVEFAGTFVAAVCVWGFTWLRPDLSREVLVPSTIISLFPGMTLTTGLGELARKNLVAGGARLMEALIAFLLIVFGIAAGDQRREARRREARPRGDARGADVAGARRGDDRRGARVAVLFAVPRSFAWAAVVSASLGWIATALGTRYLPPHVASFGAALAVCLFGNGAARVTQRPAQLFQLPGMMLLVPGSVGFLSLEDFLRGDFQSGQAKGFTMLLIAGGIVTGVLVANVVLPAKKIL